MGIGEAAILAIWHDSILSTASYAETRAATQNRLSVDATSLTVSLARIGW